MLVGLSETHDRLFPPGTRYSYSNTNYQVAAMVLEQDHRDVARRGAPGADRRPPGLGHTSIAPPDIGSPELRGYGTNATDGSLVDLTDDLAWFGNGGNGGIISTADDLLPSCWPSSGGRISRRT